MNLAMINFETMGMIAKAIGIAATLVMILMVIGMGAAFKKAGEPVWACIVPIYNVIVMLRIAGKPAWWFVLVVLPPICIVFGIMATVSFCKAYGKGIGYALGLIFLPFIFCPMLGFGDAKHIGQAT